MGINTGSSESDPFLILYGVFDEVNSKKQMCVLISQLVPLDRPKGQLFVSAFRFINGSVYDLI
jgi:hypothetical protein